MTLHCTRQHVWDGASRWQVIKGIILPALTTTMVTVLILNIGFFMNAGLDQVLNFTNPAVIPRLTLLIHMFIG